MQIRVFHRDYPDYDERMQAIAVSARVWFHMMKRGMGLFELVPRETD